MVVLQQSVHKIMQTSWTKRNLASTDFSASKRCRPNRQRYETNDNVEHLSWCHKLERSLYDGNQKKDAIPQSPLLQSDRVHQTRHDDSDLTACNIVRTTDSRSNLRYIRNNLEVARMKHSVGKSLLSLAKMKYQEQLRLSDGRESTESRRLRGEMTACFENVTLPRSHHYKILSMLAEGINNERRHINISNSAQASFFRSANAILIGGLQNLLTEQSNHR